MVKRRTLGEGLTPEQEAFLYGTPPASKPKPEPKPKKEKKPMGQPALKKDFVQTPPIEAITLPPVQTGMVGLNTRIEPAISNALLRASVDRKIQRRVRAGVQDIVNEALTEWLKKSRILELIRTRFDGATDSANTGELQPSRELRC